MRGTDGPVVEQRAQLPPGNIPKNRQTWIMLAVAAVIVFAVVFPARRVNLRKPRRVCLRHRSTPLRKQRSSATRKHSGLKNCACGRRKQRLPDRGMPSISRSQPPVYRTAFRARARSVLTG